MRSWILILTMIWAIPVPPPDARQHPRIRRAISDLEQSALRAPSAWAPRVEAYCVTGENRPCGPIEIPPLPSADYAAVEALVATIGREQFHALIDLGAAHAKTSVADSTLYWLQFILDRTKASPQAGDPPRQGSLDLIQRWQSVRQEARAMAVDAEGRWLAIWPEKSVTAAKAWLMVKLALTTRGVPTETDETIGYAMQLQTLRSDLREVQERRVRAEAHFGPGSRSELLQLIEEAGRLRLKLIETEGDMLRARLLLKYDKSR